MNQKISALLQTALESASAACAGKKQNSESPGSAPSYHKKLPAGNPAGNFISVCVFYCLSCENRQGPSSLRNPASVFINLVAIRSSSIGHQLTLGSVRYRIEVIALLQAVLILEPLPSGHHMA